MWMRASAFFMALPLSVRQALGFLAAAWAALFAFVYHVHLAFPGKITGNEAVRVAIVGLGICYCVFRIKPWARSLCIFFNIGVIGLNLVFIVTRFSALGLGSAALTLHAALNVLLFIISSYFLLVPPTAKYFKAHIPKPAQEQTRTGQP